MLREKQNSIEAVNQSVGSDESGRHLIEILKYATHWCSGGRRSTFSGTQRVLVEGTRSGDVSRMYCALCES